MKYQETHPWIQFPETPPVGSQFSPIWHLMGEVCSKIKHLADSAVPPSVHEELNRLYLIRGVQGSTAIEGNSLSEEEIGQIIDNRGPLPLSKRYQEQEIRNVVEASNQIIHDTCADNTPSLTSEYICNLNHLVLQQLELQEDVKPGVLRTHSVMVGIVYRGAPVEDCPYLMERLCTWLNSETFQAPKEDYKYAIAIIQAVCAHIYLAWIHPFGDGNGRTARLVEFYLLLKAGIPVPAAHLLSNHYNKTRSEYYLHLQKLSRKDNNDRYPNFNAFLEYALQGLVDGLREQIDTVQKYQHRVMWEYYVYQTFRNTKSKEQGKRRRDLLLSFQPGFQTVDMNSISADVYHNHYSKKTNRTLQRDLRELTNMELIEKHGNSYRPMQEIITGMLPIKAN